MTPTPLSPDGQPLSALLAKPPCSCFRCENVQAALIEASFERDQMEAWNVRLVAAMREAVSTMKREMASDEACDHPFNEDMADAIRRCEEVLSNG